MNITNLQLIKRLATAAFLVVAVSGCKGDDPKPGAPTAEKHSATAEPSNDKATKAPPAAKQISAKVVPAAKQAAKRAIAPLKARTTPSGPLRHMTLTGFDPAVATVIGTPSPDAAVDAFFALARRFEVNDVPADSKALLASVLGGELSAKNMDWVDLAGPAKLVVPDMKRWTDGFALVLTGRGGAKAVAAAFEGRFAPADGHAGTVTFTANRKVFVDELGSNIVFTSHADLFGLLKDYLAGPIAAWKPTQPLAVEIDNTNLRRIFAEDLKAAQGLLGAVGENLAGRAADPGQAATMRSMVSGVFDLISDAKRVSVVVDPAGSHARVGLAVSGEPGSTTAEVIASLKDARPSNVEGVSPDAWFAVASRIDLWKANEAELAAQIYASTRGQQLTFSKAEAAELAKHVVALSEAVESDSAFAIGEDAAFPFAVTAVTNLKSEPAVARRALTNMLNVLFRKVVAEGAKSMGGDANAAAKIDSPAKVLEMVKPLLKPLGLAVELVDKRDGAVDLQGIGIDFDWSKLRLNARDPDLDKLLKRVVGKRLEIAIGYGPKHMSFGLGPRAFALAKRQASGASLGGDPNLTRATKESFGGLSLRIGKALQALDFMPRLDTKKGAIAALPAAEAFTANASSDGTMLTFEIAVAVDLLKGLMNIR